MKHEVSKLLFAERKFKRELAELRAVRHKLGAMVAPDQKMIKMVDDEIAAMLK